jgi:hypothetical protein
MLSQRGHRLYSNSILKPESMWRCGQRKRAVPEVVGGKGYFSFDAGGQQNDIFPDAGSWPAADGLPFQGVSMQMHG